MNEEYILKIYNERGGQPVFGSYENFKKLITTNDDYASKVYNQLGGQSVFGQYENFRTLTKESSALPQQPTEVKKKEDTTVSPSGLGSSVSPVSADDLSSLAVEVQDKSILTKRPRESKPIVPSESTKTFVQRAPQFEPQTDEIDRKLESLQQEKLANEYNETDYFQGAFGNMLRGFDSVSPIGLGDVVDDLARSVAAGYRQGDVAQAGNKIIRSGNEFTDEDIQNIINKSESSQKLPQSQEFQNYLKTYEAEGKTIWGAVKGLIENPTVFPEVAISSAFSMATNRDAALAGLGTLSAAFGIGAATGGTAGTFVVPGIGTAVGALGAGLASAASAMPIAFGAASTVIETGSVFAQYLQEELGTDENGNPIKPTKENVRAILEDPEKYNKIKNDALVRGFTVGIIDAVGGKLATGVGAKILKSSSKATGNVTKAGVVKALAAGTGIGSTAGATGEVLGQVFIGKPVDTGTAVLEFMADMPGGLRTTLMAGLKVPIYKINGDKVSAEEIDTAIATMTPEQLATTKIVIANDFEGRERKVQDKIVAGAIAKEVREAQPDLNEPTVNAIVDLQKQLNILEGNKTQVAKDKAAQIRADIKNLTENQLPDAVAPTVETTPSLTEELAQSIAAQETKPTQQDAVQEQAAGQVSVQSGATVSQEVAQGEPQAEPQVTTQAGIQEEVSNIPLVYPYEPAQPTVEAAPAPQAEVTPAPQAEPQQRTVSSKTQKKIDKVNEARRKELDEFTGPLDQPYFIGDETGPTVEQFINNKYDEQVNELMAAEPAKPKTKAAPVTPAPTAPAPTAPASEIALVIAPSPEPTAQPQAQPTPAETAQPTAEPIIITDILRDIKVSFAPENAIEVQKGTREDTRGKKFTYDAAVTAQATDRNGTPIGLITKRSDGEGKLSFTVKDVNGRNINKGKAYPTEGSARTALAEQVNKQRKKSTKTKQNEQVQSKRGGDGGRPATDSKIEPLQGSPTFQGVQGPDPKIVAVAEDYATKNGIELKRQAEYVQVDEERAKRIADAYEQMADDPKNPTVKEAYENLVKQTMAQYQALVDAGYKFWFIDLGIPSNEAYSSSPMNAIRDLRQNKEMGVFSTKDGYGDSEITTEDIENNPLLANTGLEWPVGGVNGPLQPVLANDLFRAVHDTFGHGLEGAGFRARGEENAWQAHVRLFTGSAIPALTSETRGQNSYVNFGPDAEFNRTASGADTKYAPQKIGLMPEWTSTEGRASDMKTEAKPTSKKAEAKPTTKKATAKTEPVVTKAVAEEIEGKLTELSALDPKDKGTGQKILDGIDALLKDYENIEKGGLNMGIALSSIKKILKGIRALVQAGITLSDAIKQAAKDNNLTVRDITDGINALSQIIPIQAEFNALMTKADNMITRQKSRGIEEKKIVSNLDTMVRKEPVYINANDAQRKIMEREARTRMGVEPRKAASIGRVLGVLKDIANVTREEKLKIISRIRELGRDVGRELAKEIRAMKVNGQITTAQATNIISRLTNVNPLNETSVSNFVDYMAEVFAKVKEKNRQSLLRDLVKLVSEKAKTAKTESGKRRSKGLDSVGQAFFDAIKPIIKAAANNDVETLQKIKDNIDNDLIQELMIKTLNGQELTTRERVLLDQALAYDTFADLATMNIEQIQELYNQLKDKRTESIANLKSKRIERAEQVKAMHEDVDAQIKTGYSALYNEDGKLKDNNELRDDVKDIWNSFNKLKVWDGVKKLFGRYDFSVATSVFDFMRKNMLHIGTLSKILDKGGKFFTDNVYRALNNMDEKNLKGYFNQRDILDEMANKIQGIKKGFKEFKSKMSNEVITLDNIINTKTEKKRSTIINQDEAMRIYALYKNPIQREKLTKMGFDEANMQKIEKFIGPEGKQMVDMVVDYFSNQYYESVNNVYSQVNDVSLGYVENYFPTKTISTGVDADMIIDGNFNGIFDAETAPSLKERTDTTGDVELGAGFTSVVDNHIQTMERYKAYAEGVKKINSIFKSPSVQALLGEYGTNLSRVYKSLINFSINPNGGAKIEQSILEKVMTKFTGFALSYKLIQIPKQATSFITAFEKYNYRGEGKKRIPGVDTVMFMVDMAKVIATLPSQVKKAQQISASFKDRLEKGLEGDVYGLESGGRVFRPISKSNTIWGKIARAFKKGGAGPTVIGDVLGVMGYMINYNRNIANGMSEADALEVFNDYNATQQSRRAADKIPLQQSQSALARSFTMFGSTTFLQINKAVQGVMGIMTNLQAKKMPKAEDMRAVALNLALGNAFFVLASNMAMLIKGDDEDKEKALDRVFEALIGLNLIYQVPLIGGAVEVAIKKAKGDRSPTSDVINPYITVFNKIYKGVKEDDIIKSGQPIVEIVLGTQVDQFVGLFNILGGDFEDNNVYDAVGITKSFRPGGSEPSSSDKKDVSYEDRLEKDLLEGYENKTEMKRYEPELYEQNFGEGSEYYELTKEEREEKKEAREEEQKEKDAEYGYKKDSKGFGSRSKSSGKGFGAKKFGKD